MYHVLILQEEFDCLLLLKKVLYRHPLVDNVYVASSANEALNIVREAYLDIAFLDIELSSQENLNGIEVGRIIKHNNPQIELIFVAESPQYVLGSFEVHPFDFILKPIGENKVTQIINKLHDKKLMNSILNFTVNKLYIRSEGKLTSLTHKDIYFIERIGKVTFFHTALGLYKTRYTLDEMEKALLWPFYRTHKSYITNMNQNMWVDKYANSSYVIHFIDYDKSACFSRGRYSEFCHLLTRIEPWF